MSLALLKMDTALFDKPVELDTWSNLWESPEIPAVGVCDVLDRINRTFAARASGSEIPVLEVRCFNLPPRTSDPTELDL